MKRLLYTAAALALSLPALNAALITYTTRALFDAANPGLPVEGFESLTGKNSTQAFTGPLNSTSNIGGIVAPGQILSGVSFVDNPGPGASGMFIAAPGQSSQPTTALGSNSPDTDALDAQFSPSVFAVALDIFQNFGGGEQSGHTQDYTVSVFGSGGFLGSSIISVPSSGSGFFGISSTDAITRVSVLGPAGAFEVIDNVAFGGAAAAVPEPATCAMLAFGLAALVVVRRRVVR